MRRTEQEVLHSPFDIKPHKETFINYLEVIINEDGSIEYAVPSHIEKVYQKYMDKYKVSRQYIYENFAFPYDVATKLKIIMVWSDRIECDFNPSKEQLETLLFLKQQGVLNI